MDHEAAMRQNYELEAAPGLAPTREGVVECFTVFRAAFPDLRFATEDMPSSGDKVITRARVMMQQLRAMPDAGAE